MEAVKAAKAKAEYMLVAIGEKVGKAVFIQEFDDGTPRPISYGIMSNERSNISNVVSVSSDTNNTLSFSKIKLRYVVLARFEIQ